MNKKEFISYLETKLNILNETERDDIINEYIQHINNKIAEGLSEKEAVQTLGNVEDIVREILSAYNVDPDYDNNKKNESSFKSFLNELSEYANSVVDFIKSHKPDSFFELIIRIILLIFTLTIIVPYVLTLFGSVAVFGGLLIFTLMGYPLVGATLCCLGFNLAAISILLIILKFVFFNKKEAKLNENVL